MLDDVLAIPEHLRDALWRVESARLERGESAGLLVCGVGGSAIGGDLAVAALGDRLGGPLLTVRGYGLPSWASSAWTVFCSSYSGETEETLACFAAAASSPPTAEPPMPQIITPAASSAFSFADSTRQSASRRWSGSARTESS